MRIKTRLKRPGPRTLVFMCCIFAALVATLPLCRQSLAWAHDLNFQLTRIEGIYEGLLSGQFPVRINPTFINGYGYADPIMYPALFLYFPAIFRLCGMSLLRSYQLFIFAVNLMTAGLSYACARRIFKRRDLAVFAMLVYTLCLYRLICIFTRAAIGELIGMAFLPCVFLGMHELFDGAPHTAPRFLVLGFVGLINCHVLSALIAAEACLVIAIVNVRRLFTVQRISALVDSILATLLLTLWVTIPMLHLSATNLKFKYSGSIAAQNAVYPFELFATFVRSGGLSGDLDVPYTGMPLSVGGLLGAGLLVYVYLRLMRPQERSPLGTERAVSGAFALAVTSLFVTSTLFPWDGVASIPLLGGIITSIQFPWRFLGIASVGLTAVLTYTAARFAGNGLRRNTFFLVAALLVLFSAAPYLDGYMQDSTRPAVLSPEVTSPNTTMLGAQEYLRRRTSLDALLEREPEPIGYGVELTNVSRSYLSFTFDYTGVLGEAAYPSAPYVELPLYYYPLYAAKGADGNVYRVTEGNDGVVRVFTGRFNDTVTVSYRAPISYKIAEILSLTSLLWLTYKYMRDILVGNKFFRKD